jgi:hypothetical protein
MKHGRWSSPETTPSPRTNIWLRHASRGKVIPAVALTAATSLARRASRPRPLPFPRTRRLILLLLLRLPLALPLALPCTSGSESRLGVRQPVGRPMQHQRTDRQSTRLRHPQQLVHGALQSTQHTAPFPTRSPVRRACGQLLSLVPRVMASGNGRGRRGSPTDDGSSSAYGKHPQAAARDRLQSAAPTRKWKQGGRGRWQNTTTAAKMQHTHVRKGRPATHRPPAGGGKGACNCGPVAAVAKGRDTGGR